MPSCWVRQSRVQRLGTQDGTASGLQPSERFYVDEMTTSRSPGFHSSALTPPPIPNGVRGTCAHHFCPRFPGRGRAGMQGKGLLRARVRATGKGPPPYGAPGPRAETWLPPSLRPGSPPGRPTPCPPPAAARSPQRRMRGRPACPRGWRPGSGEPQGQAGGGKKLRRPPQKPLARFCGACPCVSRWNNRHHGVAFEGRGNISNRGCEQHTAGKGS
jgi:hypothetical protein